MNQVITQIQPPITQSGYLQEKEVYSLHLRNKGNTRAVLFDGKVWLDPCEVFALGNDWLQPSPESFNIPVEFQNINNESTPTNRIEVITRRVYKVDDQCL